MKKEENRKHLLSLETKDDLKVVLSKVRNKFNIHVTEKDKKIKNRKVFETLQYDNAIKEFHSIVNFLSKRLDK